MTNQKLCIVGAGGFGREVLSSLKDSFILSGKRLEEEVVFMDDHESFRNKQVLGIHVIPFSAFIPSEYRVVIAVGDPLVRRNIVNKLPKETVFETLIHPSAIVMEDSLIGEGSIITAGSTITCNIEIGKHSHINLHTTVVLPTCLAPRRISGLR